MPKKQRSKPFFDKWQSFEVDSPTVRCNLACGKNAELQTTPETHIKTMWDIFLHGLQRAGDGPCLGWRNGQQYSFIDYKETHQRILKLARALRQKSSLEKGSFVGLYSANSPQWMISAMACASSSFILVPLYDTLGVDSCSFIINEAQISVLLVDTVAAARRIIEGMAQTETPGDKILKTIVIIGAIGELSVSNISADLQKEFAAQHGIDVIPINDYLSDLEIDDAEKFKPEPDDLYMVQYTSGTTGDPKGVMLTHGNFAANEASIQSLYDNGSYVNWRPEEISPGMPILHYLPLAHSYGQLLAACGFYYGAAIGFFSGNVQKLSEDAIILRPVYMPLVPRLMNKVYAKVCADVEAKGKLTRKIFWYAYKKKRQLLRRGVLTQKSIWDKIVFKQIQAKLGGKIRCMLTASAPVSAEVLEFWRIVFGAHIFEAYGQTECTALVTAAVDADGGNIGHPVCCNMIKLVDVPEMGYLSADKRGEVCVKGPNVMKGYYKRPDLTAETIDEDGWLHTGDIGEFMSDGSLRLIDRKKHIFKLAQGEYIAPEKIESIYGSSPLVGQIYVDGNGLQWFTVAVVVPDPVEAENWCLKNEVKFVDLATVCRNEDFRLHVLNSLLALGRSKGLNGLEQIKSLYLYPDQFTIAEGLMTPSMKNRRAQLRAKFQAQLDDLYKHGPLLPAKVEAKQ